MKNKGPSHRALVVTSLGAILRVHTLTAPDDQQAIEAAKKHKEIGLGLEVWRNGKLVHELLPEESVTEEGCLGDAHAIARPDSRSSPCT